MVRGNMSSLFALLANPDAGAQPADAALNLPDNPVPKQTAPSSAPATPAPHPDSQSSAAQSTGKPATEESEQQKAGQLDKQLHQRVFGVMATFNTTTNKDALPLSTGQKYQLFFKIASDPWPFVLTAVGAGIDQAQNSFPEMVRVWRGMPCDGCTATPSTLPVISGERVLASLLREDPRYSRRAQAASPAVLCGRLAEQCGASAITAAGDRTMRTLSVIYRRSPFQLYYSAADRTVGETLERGFTVTAQAIIGSEVIEFWPDMVRHHKRKQAEKLARQGVRKYCCAGDCSSGRPRPLPLRSPNGSGEIRGFR